MSAPRALLGPQSASPTLRRVLKGLAPKGPVATIRAGWQEWESEDSPVSGILGPRGVNLRLHERAERVWREDPELMEAHHDLQRRVRTLRTAYNIRLACLMNAWTELTQLDGPAELLGPEREAALQSLRALDARQVGRVAELRDDFARLHGVAEREAVARERAAIAALLDDVPAVLVDGGHVAVILNRMRLFGVEEHLRSRVVLGVSGGAMALCERVVLFHDNPPWGPGHAEVTERGLGLARGIAVFPDATERLRLGDSARLGRLSRRLAPAECVLLDPGEWVASDGTEWSTGTARRVTDEGSVVNGARAA